MLIIGIDPLALVESEIMSEMLTIVQVRKALQRFGLDLRVVDQEGYSFRGWHLSKAIVEPLAEIAPWEGQFGQH